MYSSAIHFCSPVVDLGLGEPGDLAISHCHYRCTNEEHKVFSQNAFSRLLGFFFLFSFFSFPSGACYQTALVLEMELSSHKLPEGQCFSFSPTKCIMSFPAPVLIHSLLYYEESDMLAKFRFS